MLFTFLVVLFLSLSVTSPIAAQGPPPRNVAVRKVLSSDGAALRVTWDPPDTTVTDYQVQYGRVREVQEPAWQTRMSVGDTRSYTIEGLMAGTRYTIRVLAVDEEGKLSPYHSANGTQMTTFGVLSKVSPPTVTEAVSSGRPALTVSWSAPQSDITKYELQYRKMSDSEWMSEDDVTLTSHTLPNLEPGTEYTVRVRAFSALGDGPFSNYGKQTTFNVPNPVSSPNVAKAVSSGKPALTVSWSAPQSDSSITKYEVQYNKVTDRSWMSRDVTSPPTTLGSLDPGTEYAVRVRAVSELGEGPFSNVSKRTTFNVPPQVTGVMLSVVSGQTTIMVTWTKAIVEGTFRRYIVQYRIGSQSWASERVEDQNVVTAVLTSLQRSTTYRVRVSAVSDAGNGPYSTQATFSLPGLPSRVTGVRLSVVSGQTSITVTWTKTSVEGTFIRYDVQYKTSSQTWTASTTETVMSRNVVTVDLTNLERGTIYNVRVRAVSNAGNGSYSAEDTATVPRLPSQVTRVRLSLVSGQAAIRVNWDKPNSDRPIIRYEVEYGERAVGWIDIVPVPGADSLKTTITNLQRGTTYVVRVRAVSGAVAGIYTSPPDRPYLMLPSLPSQVTGVSLSVVFDQTAIMVSWIKPSFQGTFIRYEIQYKTNVQSWDASQIETAMAQNSISVDLTNLERGTAYYVRVRAVSNVGSGSYSKGATFTIPRLPLQVTGVSLSVVSGQAALKVNWNNPSVEGTFMRYDIQYRRSSQSYITRTVMDKNTVTVDLPGLQRGFDYTVRVRAVSNAGNGDYSAGRASTSMYLPRLPSQVSPPNVAKAVSSGKPALTVSWSKPQSDRTITKYVLQYRKITQSRWMSRDVTSGSTTVTVTLPNLDAGTEYFVQVRAVSDAGEGPFSVDKRNTTFNVPRQMAPPTLTRSVSSGPAFTVLWIRPVSKLPIIRYDVQYKLSSASSSAWSDNIRLRADTLSTLEHILPRLSAGTSYDVRVRAVSAAGLGPYGQATERTHRVPAVVSDVQVVAEENLEKIQITVSWTLPESERIITHYSVDYSLGSQVATWRSFNATEKTYVITGTLGITYMVRVAAVSDVGPGSWSDTVIIAPPSAPTGVIATSIGTSSVTITWNNVGFKYQISAQREGSSERPSPSLVSSPQSHTITGLDSNTGYTITVEAYSPLGQAGRNIIVYTLPEAPSSLNLEVVSSTVIRVTWTAPSNADRLSLTYLISYQSEFDSGMKEASNQTVELTRLHPFAEYTVSVQARNTGGQLSAIVTGKSTTLSAAPSEPPQNVQFIDRLTAQDSLTISWRIPPKNNRNGIITSYIIRLRRDSDGNNGVVGNFMKVVDSPTFQAPKNITYTVTSLFANIQYGIRVAAVTSGGTGVFSPLQRKKTALDLYVSMLTDEVNSDTSSTISWTAPEGVVTSYPVYYGVYQSDTFKMKTTTTPSIQLDNLTPETPIEVLVKPVIAQGTGGSVSKIIFSKEGVPTVPVKNVTVMRINGVSLRVAWPPLSLHEARGMPVYTVIVESTAGRTTRATVTSNTTNSTVDVDGLIPCTMYSVMVQVGTSAGTSADLISDPVTAGPCPTCTDTPESAIIVAVLVVIIMLVIGIIITVVVILFLYRARKKSANSFSPSQSESEVEIKGGKGNSVQMMALSSNSEKHGSMGELHNPAQNGNLEPVVTYETVTTSMGAPVDKSDFASHVTMMHKSRDSGFEKEYLSIVNDPEGVEAIAKANKLKNRYINIHTFDHSRVMLNVPDDNGSDYINASYIDGYKRENAYIASQGPTPSTISDFWQMIVDHKAPVIVMLTKVEEKGKKKCEQYWDETLNTKVDKGRGIQVTTVKFTPYADYEVREFQITSSSSPSVQPLKVKHFLYTAWPDHGVPQHPSSLVRFTHKVRRAYQNSAAPIIVHCSAGVGRTGTYLTIDAMMQRIREVADLNIYEFVVEMRSKRTFMVQNQDQYAFIHDALCDYITCGDTSIAAHELRRVIIEMEATDPKTKKSGFDQQFEFLGSLSKVPFGEDFKFSKKLSISKKNRFKDRFPYSNSHLHVPGKSPSNGSDYINASYVNSYSRKNAFIAAQTPLPSTVADFWELLWQFKPPTVVVLTSADDDKDGADFWPTQEEGVADYGVVKVNHKATMPCSDYDRHTLEVVDRRKDKCTPHTLKLFHFTTWSTDSAPHLSSLLDMMGEVEKNHVGSTKSITVACSDGMSRTGVFVSVMNEIERLKTENEVDLFQTIKLARSKRPYFVFTPEQYKLCFDILQAYLDSFDTYANFKIV